MNEISLDQLSFEQFQGLLNSNFRVGSDPAGALELELVEAVQYRRTNPPAGSANNQDYERFSLLFAGPADKPLPQMLHPFSHDQLGAFQLFIVPIRRDQGKLYYEAVFNRLMPSR